MSGALAAIAASGSSGAHAPRAGAATAPRCFGAASHDPAGPCRNRALRTMVVPSPATARDRPNAPCTVVERDAALKVCAFGAGPSHAVATIALLGDSHAAHWRAAVDVVARVKRWYGLSIALGGCPYSTATRTVPEPLRTRCRERNQEVPAWFARHPEVHTVFVAEISGARWVLPPGEDQFMGQMSHYREAWDALPASITHIVVIRDTPKALPSTHRCVERALAQGEDAGWACRMPRRLVLDRDAAAVAAEQSGSARFDVVDMNRYFCDDRWCFPVIGGALVQKDVNHLTAVFVATLGPYLLRAVDDLAASWR